MRKELVATVQYPEETPPPSLNYPRTAYLRGILKPWRAGRLPRGNAPSRYVPRQLQEAPNGGFDSDGCGLGSCESPRTELFGCAYSGDPVDADDSDDGVLLRGWRAGNVELSAIRRVTFIVRS